MITLGFSPCPNDTYIFYALVNNKIDLKGLNVDFIVEDIETLNQLSMSKKLDISKVSSHAYLYLKDDYRFLRAGAAFSRGCGPLIVMKRDILQDIKSLRRIGIPGKLTTAFLLMKLFFASSESPKSPEYIFMPFNKIMDSINDGRLDAGLIIHESRFTYQDHGLIKIVDLGEWWEKETGLLIPLGGIIAKKELPEETVRIVEELIKESIKYSLENPQEALPFIKSFSQELTEEVIMQHISLYVNNYSIDIGDEGWRALDELLKRAERAFSYPFQCHER